MAGDEEEDDVDDLENEFNFVGRDKRDGQYLAEFMMQGHMSYGRGGDVESPQIFHAMPQVPLLTNGQMVFGLDICLFCNIITEISFCNIDVFTIRNENVNYDLLLS